MKLVINSLRNICICTVFNILLVSFIIIISFYLIRRVNRINLKEKVETFRTSGSVCKPVIRNEINMNKLSIPLSKIATSLGNIDAKLDFVNGFKTIKTDDNNKTKSVNRNKYPFGEGDSKTSKSKSKEEQDKEERENIRKNIIKDKNEKRKENLKTLLTSCYNIPSSEKTTLCSKTYKYGFEKKFFKLEYGQLPNNFNKNTEISLICKDTCNM
jgi:hypothetical protein|tara:strand:+ start:179 stop:817 length:639 start_codon:yes stop_codon:yes gene_type:complete